jgi:hypothetical protein
MRHLFNKKKELLNPLGRNQKLEEMNFALVVVAKNLNHATVKNNLNGSP